MDTPQKRTFIRTDIWREGAWLDLWSVVHLLSGITIGLGFNLLHFSSPLVAPCVLFLLISYELWEAAVHIDEAFTNRCTDVVVGMGGYLFAFYMLAPLLCPIWLLCAWACVLFINSTMSVFGWRASQKAAVLKQRIHARYTAERTRLVKKKALLRKKFRK